MNTPTIAILGASAEGPTLAAAAVLAGFQVVLEDFRSDVLQNAVAAVRTATEEAARRSKAQPASAEALSRLRAARTVEDACREGPSLILDCTTDEMELKLEIFTLLDKFAFPGAICATNATSISISELGAITYRPELCIGLRIASHDGRPTLELVRSPRTLEDAVAVCREFAARIGWDSSVRTEYSERADAAAPRRAFPLPQAKPSRNPLLSWKSRWISQPESFCNRATSPRWTWTPSSTPRTTICSWAAA